MATTDNWYVDPDAVGGGTGVDWTNAYTSLATAEAAKNADITVSTGSDKIVIFHCQSSSGSDDTTTFQITGWTTAVGNYIQVQADDFPANGILDETKYLLHNNDSGSSMILTQEDYVRFINLQMKVTGTSTNTRRGLYFLNQNVDNAIIIDSCIIKGVISGTGVGHGIETNAGNANTTIFNTIVYDFFIAADTGFIGINCINATTFLTYNCTVYNCTRGIDHSNAVGSLAINCLVFNCEDDYANIVAVTYSASDDSQAGTGNFQITQTASDYAALVTDAPNGDFSVKDASSELYQTGNGATPKSIFTDDIIGTTRDAVDLNWDIGAFELIVGAPPAGMAGAMTTNTGVWGW